MSDLKAWVVQDLSKDYAEVVFAPTRGRAKVAGMGEFAKGSWQFTEMLARRAPEFDQYAGVGEVPFAARLANGWWFPCRDCGYGEFAQDSIVAKEAVVIEGDVFCLDCAGKRGVQVDPT